MRCILISVDPPPARLRDWCGGPAEARERADDAFRACMRTEGGACLSTLTYVGARVGGPAWMPFPWRWGYGWDWLEDPR